MAHRAYDFQRNGSFRQKSQRPVGETFRRRPQPQGDAGGFLVSVEDLTTNSLLRFALECHFKTFGHETLANVLNGFCTTVEGVGDLRVRPLRSIRICLKQNSSTKQLLRRDAFLLEQNAQKLPFDIRQPNYIFLLQASTLLGWAYIDKISLRTLP